LNRY
jgi:hypothetical protein